MYTYESCYDWTRAFLLPFLLPLLSQLFNGSRKVNDRYDSKGQYLDVPKSIAKGAKCPYIFVKLTFTFHSGCRVSNYSIQKVFEKRGSNSALKIDTLNELRRLSISITAISCLRKILCLKNKTRIIFKS